MVMVDSEGGICERLRGVHAEVKMIRDSMGECCTYSVLLRQSQYSKSKRHQSSSNSMARKDMNL